VTRSRAQYIDAMKYLRSLLEKDVDGKDKQKKIVPFSILFHVGARDHKGIFEVPEDLRDTKFNLMLCELSENCQYGFWGRFLVKGYPCWDLHSETMALQETQY
ncbi:MAG: hypothetical protein ACRDF4_04305, partial [Rhabdochlamydiaceae bacterium]